MNTARMIREDYLQQNAFDDVDTYTSFEKQDTMLTNILHFDEKAHETLSLGAYFSDIMSNTVQLRDRIARSKFISEEDIDKIKALYDEIDKTMRHILEHGGEA